jgi:hypothetical protein|tara:strand:+ start:278 stop:607 length:330 start_codon:yes stop_codon:yes gene_type:complete
MSKATEDLLGELHGRVAKSIIDALEQSSTALWLLEKKREDEPIPEDVKKFLYTISDVSPALLQAATKFLKDNSISCDASESDELDELKTQIAERRNQHKAKVAELGFKD